MKLTRKLAVLLVLLACLGLSHDNTRAEWTMCHDMAYFDYDNCMLACERLPISVSRWCAFDCTRALQDALNACNNP